MEKWIRCKVLNSITRLIIKKKKRDFGFLWAEQSLEGEELLGSDPLQVRWLQWFFTLYVQLTGLRAFLS